MVTVKVKEITWDYMLQRHRLKPLGRPSRHQGQCLSSHHQAEEIH